MKLGLLTSILDGWSFEEAVDLASDMGFSCLEAACWPKGEAKRRYAGVSHIDCERICKDPGYASYVKEYAGEKNISISALAFYPNPMDANPSVREEAVRHLKRVIQAASILDVNVVTTFIGKNQYRTVEENIELFAGTWEGLIAMAGKLGVKIAIENCPMLFGPDQWPGGQNLMCTPVIFRRLFQRIPAENFGLNFDPSHFVWQGLDYIKTVYEFQDRIFHIHFKDIKLYTDKLKECGVLAYPLEYMSPKLPGLGDVDWGGFISALNDIRYEGSAVIEIEDKAFEGSREEILRSIALSKRYLSQYL
ncbi:MAG: sugar phosphate isomerase/epimerase [Eubacteriales bacterium]|nr:sugar phosphate isomerase/epimerase [Eubacteriales bacterium]